MALRMSTGLAVTKSAFIGSAKIQLFGAAQRFSDMAHISTFDLMVTGKCPNQVH
jgi:hypothetical protein